MTSALKTLLACAFALAVAAPAAAHTKVRVYVQAPHPYYPPLVHVAPRYVDYGPEYYNPYWQDRRERRAERRAWRHRHGYGRHAHHRICRGHHHH